nr:unnamed protein product [Naegleria fowleri]
MSRFYEDIKACQKVNMLSILTGKRVNKLLQHIKEQNKNGCKMVTRGLDLRVCDSVEDAGMMGYYSASANQVVVCCNRHREPEELENTVVHELIHAYDFCRFRQLFYCKVRACSEVRAYSLSGSCSSPDELSGFTSKEQCLKARAIASTIMACKKSAVSDVHDIFNTCINDEHPFKSSPDHHVLKPHELPEADKVVTN